MSEPTTAPTKQQYEQHEAARKAAYWCEKARQALEHAGKHLNTIGEMVAFDDTREMRQRLSDLEQTCWGVRRELRRQFPRHLPI